MIEVTPGMFVGTLSAKVRDQLLECRKRSRG
ncbi:type I-E CRISPR-associated endoribonuclease Cas2 [Micromonospora sp. WMMD718]|nr:MULTISPECIES: type I-E CRISPR-associated endoribonuclease Cas2 [unclassified Micromonospora]MDG4755841.1 type I-E CRISPR-associated endoribonuclease Cas2 [Micromonospora sp. WMMD718]